jgi:multidrug efflux pump
MAVGSVFTLFIVPAFYVLIARDHSKRRVPVIAAHAPIMAPAQSFAK